MAARLPHSRSASRHRNFGVAKSRKRGFTYVAIIVVLAGCLPMPTVYDRVCARAWSELGSVQRASERLDRGRFIQRCLAVKYSAKCNDGYVDLADARARICTDHGGVHSVLRHPDG